VPLYNKEKFLAITLKSIISQSFTDFEVIIIDDGSTDNSLQIAKSYKDKRFYVYQQQNHGVSVARNKAAELSKGTYICFLDADDYWLPHHLSEFKKSIDTYPNHQVFCNNYKVETNKNTFKSIDFSFLPQSNNHIYLIDNYFKSSLKWDIAWTSAVCIKRELFLNYLFDEEIKSVQDTDLWLRLAIDNEFIFNKKPTAIYKKYIDNTLSDCRNIDNKLLLISKNSIKEEQTPFLKSYLDQNRFSIALQYLRINEKERFNQLKKEIDLSNLSLKRRLILSLNSKVLKFLTKYKS